MLKYLKDNIKLIYANNYKKNFYFILIDFIID